MMGCDTELCPNWTGDDDCICEARDIAPPASCRACGHGPYDHNADGFGGGCGVCGDCPGYDDGLEGAEELDDDAGEVEYVDLSALTDDEIDQAEPAPPPQIVTLSEIGRVSRLLTDRSSSARGFDQISAVLDEIDRRFAAFYVLHGRQLGYTRPLAIDGHEYHRRRRGRARARRRHRRRGGRPR